MAADWIGITSSHLMAGGAGVSFCGEDLGYTLTNALDGVTSAWFHTVVETHYFIINLGTPYNITAVRARSQTSRDPTNVNIYVSDDTGDWGVAVASGITTWQDRDDWDGTAVISTTPKNGQFIKVEIVSTEPLGNLRFGAGTDPYFIIFDAYGEVVPISVYPDALSLELNLLAPTVGMILPVLSLSLELDLLVPTIYIAVNPDVLELELNLPTPTPTYVISVFPDTLELELDLLTPTVVYVISVSPDVLSLELNLTIPRVGVPFPTLSTSPRFEGFIDEYSDEAVMMDTYASGYPLLNPQFTYNPKFFSYDLNFVSQADKESFMTFYNNNKKNNILWVNEQDDITYLVIFTGKPFCGLDGTNDEWKIETDLKQVAV